MGTPSTRVRRRLAISARPAIAATAVPTVAAAAPFAMAPAPWRAVSATALTVLPTDSTVSPTLSPTDPTVSEMPLPFEGRLFGVEDLLPREVDRACEVDRVREERDAFFAELPLRLDAERELAVFRGLAVLGTCVLLACWRGRRWLRHQPMWAIAWSNRASRTADKSS
jgi:hypothetical protein